LGVNRLTEIKSYTLTDTNRQSNDLSTKYRHSNMTDNLIAMLRRSFRNNWNLDAMADLSEKPVRYSDVAREIARLHLLFDNAGIKSGDKIALCGRNSTNWAIAFLAILTYDAVAVPLLNEFHPDSVHHLLNHSEARLLFVGPTNWSQLNPEEIPDVKGVIGLTAFELLLARDQRFEDAYTGLDAAMAAKFPDGVTPDNPGLPDLDPNATAIINYTSGSTGFSKGVMLSYHNIWSNLQFSIDGLTFLHPGDSTVSMLPLAHMYGLVIELLHPFVKGANIRFINRTPSPQIILKAFAEVRPKLIVAVPLIIEKVIRTRVFPQLAKPAMKILTKIPGIANIIYAKIRRRILDAFGGKVEEIIVGGAAISPDVEQFLRRIRFPFTVGYGMTECAPLIAYAPWHQQRPGSCGRPADRMEVRIDSPDPSSIPGNLWVRGDNVMQGYYKNPEATAETMGPDGWMDTGDRGIIDSDGFIYLRGRNKTMILGPSGQNIYPEEIEARLSRLPYIAEALVVETAGHKLKALIYPDRDAARLAGLKHDEPLKRAIDNSIKELNTQLEPYSRLSETELMAHEFQKTPKRSIKRYLYTGDSAAQN